MFFAIPRARPRTLGAHVAEFLLHKPMLEDAANDPQMIPKEESEQGQKLFLQTPTPAAGCGIFDVRLSMHPMPAFGIQLLVTCSKEQFYDLKRRCICSSSKNTCVVVFYSSCIFIVMKRLNRTRVSVPFSCYERQVDIIAIGKNLQLNCTLTLNLPVYALAFCMSKVGLLGMCCSLPCYMLGKCALVHSQKFFILLQCFDRSSHHKNINNSGNLWENYVLQKMFQSLPRTQMIEPNSYFVSS